MESAYESAHLNMIIDNTAVYKSCQTQLGIKRPQSQDLNTVIAHVINSVTAPFRSRDTLTTLLDSRGFRTLSEFYTANAPYPKASILTCSQTMGAQVKLADLTGQVFNPEKSFSMTGASPMIDLPDIK